MGHEAAVETRAHELALAYASPAGSARRRPAMLWLLGVAAATARPAGKPPPCSLNGFGSPCVCDPGWTGENCGQLDLLPAPPLASQVTALSATTTTNSAANSTWGISVVGPDKAGVYHGYMTEIANQCPLGDYGSASQIVHVTASNPLGPWRREGPSHCTFASPTHFFIQT